MIIESAEKKDLFRMLEILNKNLIAINKYQELNQEKTENGGFLIGSFSIEEISPYIDDKKNHIILTAKDEEIIGYLISHNLCQVKDVLYKELTSFPEINSIKDKKKILYYRQIAKLPEKKNVGSKLVEAMFDKAKEMGYEAVVCRIVHAPLQNKISIAFHEKFGFEFLGLVQNGDVTLGVYLRDLRN